MTRETDVPDVMARVAATLAAAEAAGNGSPAGAGAGPVLEPLPEGDSDVNVGRLRHLADPDLEFPSGSDRPVVGPAVRLAKRAVRRALRWYVGPIVEQQSRFNHATLDLIERLRLRVGRITGEIEPQPQSPAAPPSPPAPRYAEPALRAKTYVPWFRGCDRVVDVDGPDGELLEGLAADGTPGYGVTPEDAIGHLQSVAPGSVDGLFCSLITAPRTASEVVTLLEAASQALAPRGVVVIETAAARTEEEPRPLHPEAIRAALEATGFSGVRLEALAPVPSGSGDSSGSSLAEEIARMDDLLARRPVTALVATRRPAPPLG